MIQTEPPMMSGTIKTPNAARVLHAMGLPVPFNLGWATIVVELVGGLMILVGALIPLATVPMATVLLVPIFTVHLPVKDGEQPDQHRCHGKREFAEAPP
jgi:uncharacterized membrane protein YphA (DoxX/SURF4 family)